MTTKTYIQIWCDGSYRSEHRTIGFGWVRAHDGGQTETRSEKLPPLRDSHNHGSDVAEFSAFAGALAPLPDGSLVHVHMDCRNVVDALNAEHLSAKHMGMPAVKGAFERAVAQKKRMTDVQITFTSDSNPRMGEAHRLSREASTPPKGAKSLKRRGKHAHPVRGF